MNGRQQIPQAFDVAAISLQFGVQLGIASFGGNRLGTQGSAGMQKFREQSPHLFGRGKNRLPGRGGQAIKAWPQTVVGVS